MGPDRVGRAGRERTDREAAVLLGRVEGIARVLVVLGAGDDVPAGERLALRVEEQTEDPRKGAQLRAPLGHHAGQEPEVRGDVRCLGRRAQRDLAHRQIGELVRPVEPGEGRASEEPAGPEERDAGRGDGGALWRAHDATHDGRVDELHGHLGRLSGGDRRVALPRREPGGTHQDRYGAERDRARGEAAVVAGALAPRRRPGRPPTRRGRVLVLHLVGPDQDRGAAHRSTARVVHDPLEPAAGLRQADLDLDRVVALPDERVLPAGRVVLRAGRDALVARQARELEPPARSVRAAT